MKKRLLSMILALSMMLTILPVNAITALAANDGMSGNCGLNKGNNVTYVLTQNNEGDANPTYTLTIKGSGNMENYNHNSNYYAPWMWKKVTQVKFEGNVTSIGNYAFLNCPSLTSITIPDSVVSIGAFAFCNCSNLENVVMPNDSNSSLKSIGANAFYQCKKLKSITIPSSVISIGRCAFDVTFNQNPLKVYFPAELPNNIDKELNNYNSYVQYYYPGYKSDLDNEIKKFDDPSEYNWLQSVHYYCDVTIDANGGSFSDGTETKVVKKVWSEEKLTQEQVKAIGVPRKAQMAFSGWKYNSNFVTENLANVKISGNMTFCAGYTGTTVTLGQLNNGNELVKGNSYEFTVTIKAYSADSGSPTKKLTFGDVAGTIKEKNGKTVGAEGLEVTLPDGGEKTLTFTFTPNEVGQNKTLTAYLDGLKYKEEEYGPVTSDITYSVRDRQNAEVTITGLDGTTVKAGEVQDFTVSVTPNDDTINKVTFDTTSGEVQWSSDNGNTWTTVSGDVDYSALTGKKFRVVPAADAENGNVTVTVTAKKADGTEIAKTASFTVTAREHATVKINELNGKTIKQNKAHTFTVTVTAHDDGGETTLKFDNVAGLTYNGTAVTDAGVTVALTKNQSETLNFTLTPSETGSKTLTATLSTSGATDTATYTVSEYEHAKVTIEGLGDDLKQGESKDFTVKVDPKDDSGDATIDFGDKNSEIQYKDGEDWKSMPSGGLKINLSNGEKPYDFRITPKNDGSQTLTATVKQNDNELDRVEQTYTVAKKDEPTTPGGGENPGENPGGGSTGGGENPGGGSTGGGENPGGGSTGDSGNTKPTPKPDEKPDRKIKIDGGIVEVNGKEVKPDEDGNITVKKDDEITVTVDKSKISDAQVFDQWVIKPDSVLNEVDPKSEKISFTMPAEDVTIEAMTRDASIEDDGPGILGTGALIATGVVGSAALLYQGHMLGTELYLRYLLPHGAVIPQNRAELAVLLWQDAENPEPVSTTLYSDISDEDSAIQQAARWAVENDLMEQLDADEHPDHFDPFVPVTFSDSIRAWKKAQELKKSVH